MKTLKVTIYYSVNKQSFIATKTLTRQVKSEALDGFNWKEEMSAAAERLLVCEEVWRHGPTTTVTVRNFRFQLVEEL